MKYHNDLTLDSFDISKFLIKCTLPVHYFLFPCTRKLSLKKSEFSRFPYNIFTTDSI